MSDLFLVIVVPVIVIVVAFVINWFEYRGRCRHTWSRWDDPENTGVNVIQRRTCDKCNLMDSRVVIPNATITYCEEDHVAVPNEGKPTQAVDQKTAA
jgi:hypothetical protein